jgi:hypothetical protein
MLDALSVLILLGLPFFMIPYVKISPVERAAERHCALPSRFPAALSWPVLKGRILLEETGFESTPFPFAGKRKTKTISTLPQA